MTLMALVVAVTAGAQGTTIHEYPWNPDSDNDNLIGINDLLDFLPVFGDEFGNPPEPCDYDGTPLEELMAGNLNGTIILDSLFIQFELQDETTYYLAGCPDPISDTLVFSTAAMLDNFNISGAQWTISGNDSYGHGISFAFEFIPTTGNYQVTIYTGSIYYLGFGQDGFFGSSWHARSPQVEIPFPDDWYLDEEGIHLEGAWEENDWAYYANYLHILPYWHYAE